MKKWITAFAMICIFPCVGFTSRSNQYLKQAEQARNAAQHKACALLCEKAIYYAETNTEVTEALCLKINSQLSEGDFRAALNSGLRIQYFDLTDSLRLAAHHTTALAAYLSKEFEQALFQLEAAEQELGTERTVDSKILQTLVLNELRLWSRADSCITYYISSKEIDPTNVAVNSIFDAYRNQKHPKIKNPDAMSTSSMFLPGSGQLRNGYWLDGAFQAAGVLTGLGLAAYGIATLTYVASASITGLAIYQTSMVSGMRRAAFLTEKRNYLKTREFNDKLRLLILSLHQ